MKCPACNGTGERALLISTYPCDDCNGTGDVDMLAPLAAPARSKLTELGGLVVPEYRKRQWWYHNQIAEALEGLLRYVRFKGQRGGYARVIISMPPQHGKSLHGTELFPAFALGQDPDLKIIVASNTAEMAKKGITNARMWMNHPSYQATFPTRLGRVEEFDVKSSKRTRVLEVTDSSQFFRTIRKGTKGQQATEGLGYYLGQGMNGSITGWGYDIGGLDDVIKNAEQAFSDRYKEKVWEFYTTVFDTRERSEFSGQFYIGTMWTDPDFSQELEEHWRSQSTDKHPLPIKVLRFPALAEETPRSSDDPRKPGEGLDNPEHRSTAYYEGKRTALMIKSPATWYAMWQQDPREGGHKFFQPSDWMWFDKTFKLQHLTFVDFSIDANLSPTGSSFAVIQVWGVLQVGWDRPNEAGEHFFLLDESRGHYAYDDDGSKATIKSEFVRLQKKWKAALPGPTSIGKVWVEDKALGPTLISRYQGEYPIVAVPKARAKGYCYSLAAPKTAMHRVRLPSGTWGVDPTNPALPLITDAHIGSADVKGSWIHELKSHGKPDDRKDALAQEIICRYWDLGMHLLGAGSKADD